MTTALTAKEIVSQLSAKFPGAIEEAGANAALVKSDSLLAVAEYLKTADGLKFDYLNYITAVDYYDYFEVVYHLFSLAQNKILALKVRCCGRENLQVPSVTTLWKGADFMEREVFDLFGISFAGHPNLKRIFLWEGFTGYPLRKDYL